MCVRRRVLCLSFVVLCCLQRPYIFLFPLILLAQLPNDTSHLGVPRGIFPLSPSPISAFWSQHLKLLFQSLPFSLHRRLFLPESYLSNSKLVTASISPLACHIPLNALALGWSMETTCWDLVFVLFKKLICNFGILCTLTTLFLCIFFGHLVLLSYCGETKI